MEMYYRDYCVVKEFLRKTDRVVYLAKARSPIPGYPIEFVVKEFIGKEPQEVSIHKQLQDSYSYILRVFDVWTSGNNYYMSIEYCEDGDLHSYLQLLNGQPLGFQYILHIALQLSDTVSFMHQQKICHRDIKPLNIYMTNNRQAYKLADFGEAKRVDENNTGYHTITGTPYYMSPEQKGNFQNKLHVKVNPYRDDIWALGRTFIEISLGKLCPETFEMSTSALHHFIDQKFGYFNYNSKFTAIVKSMMVDLKDYNIEAIRVRSEILQLYNELYNPSQRVALANENNSVNHLNNENIQKSYQEDVKDQQVLSSYGELKPISEDISGSDSSDFSSDDDSSCEYKSPEVGDKPRFSVPDPENSPLTPVHNFYTQVEKFEVPSPKIPVESVPFKNLEPPVKVLKLESSPNSYAFNHSKTDKDLIKNLKEVKGCEKISIVTDRIREINPRVPDKPAVNEIPNGPVSLNKTEDKSPKIPPPVSDKLALVSPGVSEKKSLSIVSENIDILPPINIPIVPLQKPNKGNCTTCKQVIEDAVVVLPCKDPYHEKCFISYFQGKLENLERKCEPLKCFKCNYSISFEFFDNISGFKPIVKKIVLLLIYSSTSFSCPICRKDLNSNMLNRKFKAKTKSCSTCKYKFCTFCSVRGSHRFNCDMLKDFKRSTILDSNYIQK